jgi:hypothetical protein
MGNLHSVSSLQQRYDLASCQAVYDRLNALNIKPVSLGKLSTDLLDKLDRLDKCLKSQQCDRRFSTGARSTAFMQVTFWLRLNKLNKELWFFK